MKVAVIGLGYVGLPFAISISKGFISNKMKNSKVIGIDNDLNLISKIKNKGFPLITEDLSLEKTFYKVIKSKNLEFSSNINSISEVNIIIVSINFDLRHYNSKRNKFDKNFIDLFQNIGSKMKNSALLVTQSTLPPGTGNKMIIPIILSEFKKRNINQNDLKYIHSYERVTPGSNYLNSIINSWRCFGANNKKAAEKFKKFADIFINTKKYPLYQMNDVLHSETAKILENSYRALNIAFIDEWEKFSRKNNINLFNILNGIRKRPTHKNIMSPGLGVGGYCLTKDPLFMNYSKKILNDNSTKFKFTNISVKINKKMTDNSISILEEFFYKNFSKESLKKINLILFGVAYKSDVGDLRYSASNKIYDYLKSLQLNIQIIDPYVINYNKVKTFKDIKFILLNRINVLIFCTGHKQFKKINFDKFDFSKKYFVFDTNNCLSDHQISCLKKRKVMIKRIGDGTI